MPHLLGYARVSTALQDESLQLDALNEVGCARIYTDRVSSRLERRPELNRMLERADAGDTIVVWRFDRLARSLRELIDLVTELGKRGVQLRSLTEELDTSTSGGRLLFHIFASIAEFERDLIHDRTIAGLAAARARGRTGGRPTLMTPQKIAVARRMYYEKGTDGRRAHTVQQIAETVGVSRATIYKALQQDPSTT